MVYWPGRDSRFSGTRRGIGTFGVPRGCRGHLGCQGV